MKPLILYHGPNCSDGFCAAWVARRALGDIEAIPVQYGQEPPDVNGCHVYILDFSYGLTAMLAIFRDATKLVVLDHHKSAQEALAPLIGEKAGGMIVHFDMDKSGGRLTWEYFFPGQNAPWLVDYTEDRDLWLWRLQDSKAINAWLRSYPLDFQLWDELAKANPLAFDGHCFPVGEGQAILRREKQIIDEHVSHAREIEMNGHKILAVNATVLFSEIAGELAKTRPFGACYFDRDDGKRQWSLRSDEFGLDVSEIAKLHGGGGHKHAAGYEETKS